MNAPRVHSTSLGYSYVRCRARGDDSTVYIHQLVMIREGEDPRDVFAPTVDVHHCNHVPWDNRASNLRLEDWREHRTEHVQGEREPEVVV